MQLRRAVSKDKISEDSGAKPRRAKARSKEFEFLRIARMSCMLLLHQKNHYGAYAQSLALGHDTKIMYRRL